jgi:hypothetical protein
MVGQALHMKVEMVDGVEWGDVKAEPVWGKDVSLVVE